MSDLKAALDLYHNPQFIILQSASPELLTILAAARAYEAGEDVWWCEVDRLAQNCDHLPERGCGTRRLSEPAWEK